MSEMRGQCKEEGNIIFASEAESLLTGAHACMVFCACLLSATPMHALKS